MVSRRVTDAHTTQVPGDWWRLALILAKIRGDGSLSGLICRWVIAYVRRNQHLLPPGETLPADTPPQARRPARARVAPRARPQATARAS